MTPIRLSLEEQSSLWLHLARMVQAHIPTGQGIEAAQKDDPPAALAAHLDELSRRLQAGASLAQALEQCTAGVVPWHWAALQAGERAGCLSEVLGWLAEHAQALASWKKALRLSVVYPLGIILLLGLFLLFLSAAAYSVSSFFTEENALNHFFGIFSIPSQLSKGEEPQPALIPLEKLLAMGCLFLLITGLIVSLLYFFREQRRGSWLMLNLPVVGPLLRANAYTRFCFILRLLLRARLPLPEALELTGQALGNGTLQVHLQKMREQVVAGSPGFSGGAGAFPPTLLARLGFAQGQDTLETHLADMANDYHQESVYRLDRFSLLFSSVMVLLAGLLILLSVLFCLGGLPLLFF